MVEINEDDVIGLDPEIEALLQVSKALEPLPKDARERVLGYAYNRFAPGDVPVSRTPQLKNGVAGGPSPAAVEKSTEIAEFKDFPALYNAAKPKTGAEKVLVACYWLQKVNGYADLDSFSVNKLLRDMGHAVSDIANAVTDLTAAKPALAYQVKKSGKTRQAKKKYRLTTEGINTVERMINRLESE